MSDNGTPEHWKVVRLADIAEVRLGRQRSPKRAVGEHMRPYMRAANVTWKGIDLGDVKEMDFTPKEFQTYELRAGDILLAEASGSSSEVGKPAIWRNEVPGACFQNTLIRVRAPRELVPFLHLHFFKDAVTGAFAKSSRGVGIHHLGAEAMSGWPITLPPPEEQKAIVAAIESHFSRLDAATSSLERVQRNLERYRASVLKAAVEGRLVPTEAELAKKEGRSYEPASVLLKRILAERRRRWEEAELAKLKAKGKPPTDDRWKSRYEEPAAPDTDGLPDLPDGWCWTTLEAIAEVRGGLAKGKHRRSGEKLAAVPYLRVANVQRGHLDLSEVKTIEATDSELADLALRSGDILFNEGGDRDKLGRGWIWRAELPVCIHQNHVFRARLLCPQVLPEFVSWHGNSNGQRYFFDEGKHTTNLASLSLSKLRGLPVPLPPHAEQVRIRTDVERLHSLASEAATFSRTSQHRTARLRQSILKWAFEGRLVDASTIN